MARHKENSWCVRRSAVIFVRYMYLYATAIVLAEKKNRRVDKIDIKTHYIVKMWNCAHTIETYIYIYIYSIIISALRRRQQLPVSSWQQNRKIPFDEITLDEKKNE